MLYGIAALLLMLGVTSADSDLIAIPFILTITGAALLLVASRKEASDDE